MQADLGLSLEIFDAGPDQGIDIRYIGVNEASSHTIIGQCKRWAEDSFTDLLRHLKRDELPKIKKLAPQRYILLTSVKLTPARKDKIVAALRPWIQSPNDVFGKQDISGLLARYPEVERRHIKLWLTSTEVLDALLNSDVFNRSEDALDRIERQLRLWVPNPSYSRSRDILESNHVCVISGAPGIGKTMLANVLSAAYVSLGYQLVAISENIEEGQRAWRSNVPQVFLYDDFLGHVTYGELHLRKNEESQLAHFLARVRTSENKRFILTTREYILAEAVQRYESLSDVDFSTLTEIVSLDEYTQLIRAQILYNHLFFSRLPHELKTALLPEKRYWDVILHHNYNPRVIEHVVGMPSVASLNPDEFVANIFATLDNPAKVWERIFENLSNMARRVLLAVASLPSEALLEDVRHAVESLSQSDFDAGEFKQAISMLEGTFITLKEASPEASDQERFVVIRDQSIRDYLWARFESVEGEADALLRNALYFEQCVILYEGRNHAISMRHSFHSGQRIRERVRDVVDYEAVASRAVDLFNSTSPVVSKWSDEDGDYSEREPINLERRAAFLLSVFVEHQTSQSVAASAKSALVATIEAWEARHVSPRNALGLFRQVMRHEGLLDKDVLDRAKEAFWGLATSRLRQREDFEVLVEVAQIYPSFFASPQRSLESWSTEFQDYLEGKRVWLLEELEDPDWLEGEMRYIGRIASAMDMDISKLEAEAESRLEELRTEWEPDSDYEMPELDEDPREESDGTEIDALFRSLR